MYIIYILVWVCLKIGYIPNPMVYQWVILIFPYYMAMRGDTPFSDTCFSWISTFLSFGFFGAQVANGIAEGWASRAAKEGSRHLVLRRK